MSQHIWIPHDISPSFASSDWWLSGLEKEKKSKLKQVMDILSPTVFQRHYKLYQSAAVMEQKDLSLEHFTWSQQQRKSDDGSVFLTMHPRQTDGYIDGQTCPFPVGLKCWNVSCPRCQPSVSSASYITLTGHFTPGFRIPAERPPQTLRVAPARWERHSQPAERSVWTFADWPQTKSVQLGKIMTNDFFYFPFFLLGNQKKKIQLRVIQYSSFNGVTFSDWQRGRSGFK